MMPGSASAAGRLYSAALGPATATSTEYSSFTTFDPLMENPPNASVQDVPPTSVATTSSDYSMATSLAVAAASNLGPAHAPSIGGGTSTFKPTGGPGGGGGPDTSEFFPAEMAEILGSPTGSTSLSGASNGLTGSAFGPPLSLMASSDSYSDLTQTSSLHHHAAAVGSLQPLSNASMESRGSTEDDTDEASVSGRTGDNKVSVFSKAIRSLNDFGSVYSFD